MRGLRVALRGGRPLRGSGERVPRGHAGVLGSSRDGPPGPRCDGQAGALLGLGRLSRQRGQPALDRVGQLRDRRSRHRPDHRRDGLAQHPHDVARAGHLPTRRGAVPSRASRLREPQGVRAPGEARLLHDRDDPPESHGYRRRRRGSADAARRGRGRGLGHREGGRVQEDQVPHARERRLRRCASARDADAHQRVLADLPRAGDRRLHGRADGDPAADPRRAARAALGHAPGRRDGSHGGPTRPRPLHGRPHRSRRSA